jgi:cytochrome oxidase assembly protein ShyY1
MLGLLVVLLAIAAVCARLGVWQLDRAQRDAEPSVPSGPTEPADVEAAPLADVLAPQATFTGSADGRFVEARGRFGADEVLVPGRELDGVEGVLVVTPFVVADTSATLAVVRGWAATPEEATQAPAPAGDVVVRGVLQVGEAAGDDAGLPPGQVAAVSPAQLVNRWGGPMYTGYLLLEDGSDAGAGLRAVPPPEPPASWDLQNLAYALQWWLFGGFAVLLWARLVRDEARREVEAGAGAEGEAVEGGGD